MDIFRQLECHRKIERITRELQALTNELNQDQEEQELEPSIIKVMVVIEDECEKFWTMYEGPLDEIPEKYKKYRFEVVRGHRSNEITLFAKDKRANIDTENNLGVTG